MFCSGYIKELLAEIALLRVGAELLSYGSFYSQEHRTLNGTSSKMS